MSPGLTLVLPVLNEAENLRALLPQLLAGCESLAAIIVVDDQSTDGTDAVVSECARSDPRLRLLRRSGPPSLTASLQAGIDACTTDLVGWMDADGSMGARELDRLRCAVEAGADLAVGSRYASHGRIKGQTSDGSLGRLAALRALGHSPDPWTGVALSWGLNCVVLPVLLRARVHDYTSGFAVARRQVFDHVRLRGDHGEYFIDLWRQAWRRRLRVVEVGYAIRPRDHGESKTGTRLVDFVRRTRPYLAAAVWRLTVA